MWLFNDIMLQYGHWSEVFLWINQTPHIQWNKFIIPIYIGNLLIKKVKVKKKSINVFSKFSGLKYN